MTLVPSSEVVIAVPGTFKGLPTSKASPGLATDFNPL